MPSYVADAEEALRLAGWCRAMGGVECGVLCCAVMVMRRGRVHHLRDVKLFVAIKEVCRAAVHQFKAKLQTNQTTSVTTTTTIPTKKT